MGVALLVRIKHSASRIDGSAGKDWVRAPKAQMRLLPPSELLGRLHRPSFFWGKRWVSAHAQRSRDG
jgi:hypothetical protein